MRFKKTVSTASYLWHPKVAKTPLLVDLRAWEEGALAKFRAGTKTLVTFPAIGCMLQQWDPQFMSLVEAMRSTKLVTRSSINHLDLIALGLFSTSSIESTLAYRRQTAMGNFSMAMAFQISNSITFSWIFDFRFRSNLMQLSKSFWKRKSKRIPTAALLFRL